MLFATLLWVKHQQILKFKSIKAKKQKRLSASFQTMIVISK